ncbi:MAG TPA: GGDEF domain-containing protein [Deltaproteobacteria bacterium]|nr:GGDEF domain-containing protein [Deltaproteobacteria bacterium]
MEHLDRNQYVEFNKFDKLIKTLHVSMSATIVNSIIIAVVLWKVIPHGRLTVWCSVNICYALLRYVIIYYYKRHFSKTNFQAWKIGTFISFGIAGILFGSSGILLIDPSHFEYVIFLYFIAGGMVVGSAGSYHNDLPIYFVYSSTVFMIPTAGLYLLDMGISTPMVVLGIIFYVIVSVMAIRLSRDLSESLLLRYDNIQLVKSLEEAKTHTERLNAELMEKNMELNELSLVDPLTSLRNRRYLFEIVVPEIEASGRNFQRAMSGHNSRTMDAGKGYGLFIVDIDHFKQVNDNYGHDSGDMVLVQFANKLKESLRSDDVVSRFGGEEFVVVLKNVDEIKTAEIVKKLHDHIQTSIFTVTDNRQLSMTCSIGFLFYPLSECDEPIITFEKLISIVDSALYYAKDHGRNAVAKATFIGQRLDFTLLKENKGQV